MSVFFCIKRKPPARLVVLKKPFGGAEEKNPLIIIEMRPDKLHNKETKGLAMENIQTLVNNGCHVISRVFFDNPGVEIRPYILRICPEVMWNGRVIKEPICLNEVLEGGFCELDTNEFRLYFPKLYNCSDRKTTDDYKNLTVLGWVLQQVGINICTRTPLTDLDLIKTQKIEFT